MVTQLTIDSYVVSSTVIDAPKPAPVTALVPNLADEPYSHERIARMFDRKLPLPSAIWDNIKSVVFVAFVRAPIIELAASFRSA